MAVIVLAGFWAGAVNAVVGSGTLITFPTLVAMGYPPVTATMSNMVGLVAGQGILLVGAMGTLLPESVQRITAAKNLTNLLVSITATLAYISVAFNRISWLVAGLIAIGSLIGGWSGAHYGRRLSPNALRG